MRRLRWNSSSGPRASPAKNAPSVVSCSLPTGWSRLATTRAASRTASILATVRSVALGDLLVGWESPEGVGQLVFGSVDLALVVGDLGW